MFITANTRQPAIGRRLLLNIYFAPFLEILPIASKHGGLSQSQSRITNIMNRLIIIIEQICNCTWFVADGWISGIFTGAHYGWLGWRGGVGGGL